MLQLSWKVIYHNTNGTDEIQVVDEVLPIPKDVEKPTTTMSHFD